MVPENCLTKAIAPEDYTHIYNMKNEEKLDKKQLLEKLKIIMNSGKTTNEEKSKKLPENCPTMAIAPEDYKHIYNIKNDEKIDKKQLLEKLKIIMYSGKSNNEGKSKNLPENCPTTAIAPGDYKHVYDMKRDKNINKKELMEQLKMLMNSEKDGCLLEDKE